MIPYVLVTLTTLIIMLCVALIIGEEHGFNVPPPHPWPHIFALVALNGVVCIIVAGIYFILKHT